MLLTRHFAKSIQEEVLLFWFLLLFSHIRVVQFLISITRSWQAMQSRSFRFFRGHISVLEVVFERFFVFLGAHSQAGLDKKGYEEGTYVFGFGGDFV